MPVNTIPTLVVGSVIISGVNDYFRAQGGTPPYTWSLASGTLPAGLSLSATTGAIAGTPTTAGPPN